MSEPSIFPTPEQHAILSAAKGSQNLMLRALAGCGKTATLDMIEKAQPASPVLLLCFNKKIAEDAKKRLRSSTIVKTFNGLGHSVWSDTIGRRLTLNPRKTRELVKAYISSAARSHTKDLWDDYFSICEAVDRAKTLGYIPSAHPMHAKSIATIDQVVSGMDEQPQEAGLRAVDSVLVSSIRSCYDGVIDFNDQLYMPVLFTGVFPRFPLILVDEYQDLNPLNHRMIAKLARNSRLIGVGDPNQNIYGFRGAAPRGMSDAIDTYQMSVLPLSVSFRCPESIVRGVHWHVPEMRWSRAGGSRQVLARPRLQDIADDSAVLCRNNAPLLALAMRLLSAGRSVNVAGSDIGPKILGQMKKLGDETLPRDVLLGKIAEWAAAKLDAGSTSAEDTADCMRVFASHGRNLSEALLFAKHLFEQQGSITLSTVHKAKGLEWPRVYLLDPFLMRAPEDNNLLYVAQTRSSDAYFELNSGRIE